MRSIHEVLAYGPIVATNEEFDILVTVNRTYFNIWYGDYNGKYRNTECYATGFENGLYGQDMAEVVERAEAILEKILASDEEEYEE